MRALRARYRFNPRVPSGTKILICFSFDANFYSNFIFFILDLQYFLQVQIYLLDILKRWFYHWKCDYHINLFYRSLFFLSKLPSNPLWWLIVATATLKLNKHIFVATSCLFQCSDQFNFKLALKVDSFGKHTNIGNIFVWLYDKDTLFVSFWMTA